MRLRQWLVLVVDAGVEAERLRDPGAFLRPAGDADGAAAQIAGDLADKHADRAGGGGDQHGLTLFGPADLDEAVIGGLAGDAVERDQVAERLRIGRQLLQPMRLVHGIVLPADRRADDIAGGKPVGFTLRHDADAVAVHDLAGADPLAVGVALHPGPVGGVERQQEAAHLDLPVARRRDVAGPHLEMALLQLAGGSFDQENPAVRLGHGTILRVGCGTRALSERRKARSTAPSRPAPATRPSCACRAGAN